jgi:hypothetical protein
MSETTNTDDIKRNLSNAPWRKAGELAVEGQDGVESKLFIRRPPPKYSSDMLKRLKAEGLVDEKGEPVSTDAALEMAARMFAPMIYLPGAVRPLYTPAELLEVPWFTEAAEACKEALKGTKALVEEAKGNSEATPS